MSTLYAKNPRHIPLTLRQHACDTEEAALAIFRKDRRIGQNYCRFFGIADQHDRFLLNLRIAALFHDLGKANAEFQQAVTRSNYRQSLRHEHISALVLSLDVVRNWLGKNPQLDLDAITAAVLSHHLKAAEHQEDYLWCQPRGTLEVTLHLSHPDIDAILSRVAAAADLAAPPRLPAESWKPTGIWGDSLRAGKQRARALRRTLGRDPAHARFIAAIKAAVIVADSAASGLVRTGEPMTAWIDEVAHKEALTPDKLERDILAGRCAALARKRGTPFEYHEFQKRAAGLGPRALILAGCGSGKTLAAWKWAKAQVAEHKLGHVLFLYPTRGTATEGFRDYVAWAPEDEAALVHGTSEYELGGMWQNPSEATSGKRFMDLIEAEARLYALGLWPRRYFSATVDQLLAFLEHRYESLCLLPVLTDSAVILDEVHSYDDVMFQNLIAFLKHFTGPVLCMTATLPPDRKKHLADAGLTIYPGPEDRAELRDLEEAEGHKRYRIEQTSDDRGALGRAMDAYKSGRRVLWVVNTIARCQSLAREMATALGAALGKEIRVYHSRFRLRDRQDVHRGTVDAFQTKGRRAFAITTQVCEMSLDLDAEVLLSELAPIPSLVQRLGRANRHGKPGSPERAAIYLYDPPSPAPYDDKDLAATRAFLADIGTGELSQRDLACALERHTRAQPTPDDSASFLRAGYYAVPGSIRDIEPFAVPCVLDTDLADIAHFAGNRREQSEKLPGYELSVPRRSVLADYPKPAYLPSYLRIAPGSAYDAALGFVDDIRGPQDFPP